MLKTWVIQHARTQKLPMCGPLPQYSEWTAEPLNGAICHPIFMQFTGCKQPVQHSYWPANAIDWLR